MGLESGEKLISSFFFGVHRLCHLIEREDIKKIDTDQRDRQRVCIREREGLLDPCCYTAVVLLL